jgi:hypothetical protein
MGPELSLARGLRALSATCVDLQDAHSRTLVSFLVYTAAFIIGGAAVVVVAIIWALRRPAHA